MAWADRRGGDRFCAHRQIACRSDSNRDVSAIELRPSHTQCFGDREPGHDGFERVLMDVRAPVGISRNLGL